MTNKQKLEIIKHAIECDDKIEVFSDSGDLLEISDLWCTPYGIAMELKTK